MSARKTPSSEGDTWSEALAPHLCCNETGIVKNDSETKMGLEGSADLIEPVPPQSDCENDQKPPASTSDLAGSAAVTSLSSDARADDASPANLEQIAADLIEIKGAIFERIQYDEAKDKAFDRLYRQLDDLRADRDFDQLRPLYLDLILLFDRLDKSAAEVSQLGSEMKASDIMTSLREELLEVLYRREVQLISPSSPAFDPKWQRAVGTLDAALAEQHNTVGSVVRRGFRYRDRLIRPEEVVLYRFQQKGCA